MITRLSIALAAILLLAGFRVSGQTTQTFAQAVTTFYVTADHTDLEPFSNPLSMPAGSMRYTLASVNNLGEPTSFSNSTVRMLIRDLTDSNTVGNLTGTVATEFVEGNRVVFHIGSLFAKEYIVEAFRFSNSNTGDVLRVAAHHLTVTNMPAGINVNMGGVAVSVTTTANVSIAESGSGNVVTGAVASGSTVTIQRGTVTGGGGGGITSINGSTGSAHSIIGLGAIAITNFGDSTFIGINSVEGGLIIVPSWSSISEMTWQGMVTQQYTVGAGVTQLWIEGWGPASTYSPGGYVGGYLSVTGGAVLEGVVGQWGVVAFSNNVGLGGWAGETWKGGNAQSTNGVGAFSGAGLNWLRFVGSTQFIAVVAGGGGGQSTTLRSPGGGSTGFFGGTAGDGGAGTQTNGGARASSSTNATSGAFMTGGNGTPIGAGNPGGGGSAGYYGGGGAAASAGSSLPTRLGGSGSSFIGGLYSAVTIRQATDSRSPPRTDSPYWKSPWGFAAESVTTNNSHSNPGAWVIVAP